MIRTITGYFILGLNIILLSQCGNNTSIVHSPPPESQRQVASDSLFQVFETLAEGFPEQYVMDPDSFLHSFELQPQTFEQQEMYAYGLLFMAYGLREYGDHYNSIRYYEKALEAVNQYNLSDVDKHLYIYKPLAALYTLIDDNEKSINLLEIVLQELPPTAHEDRAGYANNLANAYLYNNECNKAENLLLQTLDNTYHPLTRALLFNTLSSTYSRMENLANSRKFNQKALAVFEKSSLRGDTLLWYSSALTQYADLHQHIPTAKQALELLNSNFPHSQHRSKASAQLVLAAIYYGQGDLNNAIPAYKTVTETFEELGMDQFVLDYKHTHALHALARCYAQSQQADSALHYFQWAIENDFRTQQLITSRQNQLNNNRWNRTIIEEMADLVDKELQKNPENQALIETFLWCVELSKGRLLINEINRFENWDNASVELQDALHTIRQLYQRMAQSESHSESQQIKQKIEQLLIKFQLSERYFETMRYAPKKENFVGQLNAAAKDYFSYFIRRDSSVIVLAQQSGKYHYHRIDEPGFIDTVRQFKQDYFGDNPHSFNRDPKAYQQKAHHLAKRLLPNLAHTRTDIHLSLDGDLYGLPFDALYLNGYIVERHNMAYLNSFILYDLLKREASEQTEISLLYRAEFPDPLPDLNFVHEEVRTISRRLDAHQISPEQQHDSIIVREFAATRAIHIAAHTLLDSTENPVLYLQKPISTEQLRFYHIHSPMIFLSACNTGSGQALPSEGMESIQRVFLGKGVPSVLSTYWFANDEAMLHLTTLFYDQLLENGRPVVALANAKRLFLQSASIEQQNPWYWSNINYAGVDNKVGLRKSSSLPRLMGIGIAGSLVILLSIYLFKVVSRGGRQKPRNQ